MSKKDLLVAAMRIMDAIGRGDAICKECGEIMERTDDPEGGADIWVCPSCGYQIPDDEYEYERDEEDDYEDENAIPVGCAACGGPYPDCMTACDIFDD